MSRFAIGAEVFRPARRHSLASADQQNKQKDRPRKNKSLHSGSVLLKMKTFAAHFAPSRAAALADWILAVPLGYALAFPGQRGAVGIWTGLAAGLAVAALGIAWRFHRKSRSSPRAGAKFSLRAHFGALS